MEETVKEIQSRWEVGKGQRPYEVASTLTSIKNGVYLGGSAICSCPGGRFADHHRQHHQDYGVQPPARRSTSHEVCRCHRRFYPPAICSGGLIFGPVATIAFLMLWAGCGYNHRRLIAENQTLGADGRPEFHCLQRYRSPLYGGFALLGIGIGVGETHGVRPQASAGVKTCKLKE